MPSKQEFLQEALKSAVKGTAVPALMLLKVIKNYHDSISAHKREMTTNQAILRASKKERDEHQRHIKEHDAQIGAYHQELERSRTIAKGEKGDQGIQGIIGPMGPAGIDGNHGIDGRHGIDGNHGKDAVIDEKAFMNRLLGRIKNEQLLDLSHIKGAQGFIKDGVKYKFEELMHGGGGKSSSGSAPTTPSGTINGSNITFTATTQPTIVFTEGGSFTNGFGVTITGSGSAYTIVFAAGLAPQQWIYYI
jgi:hypothetical protein